MQVILFGRQIIENFEELDYHEMSDVIWWHPTSLISHAKYKHSMINTRLQKLNTEEAKKMNKKKKIKKKRTDLSRWNFRLCTTCGIFWRKFHRWRVSSVVAEIRAPSLIKNCNCITAVHPSCFTWTSTPGLPRLRLRDTIFQENIKYLPKSIYFA